MGKSNKKCTTESFIEKAKAIHGNKYDYSQVNYINALTKITVICSTHGNFYPTPSSHVNNKSGCSKCFYENNPYNDSKRISITKIIEDANKIHNNKYDYSKIDYKNKIKKVIIICSEHGEFRQSMYNHINCKQGCPKCANILIGQKKKENAKTTFIEKANKKHKNKYDYSLLNYTDSNSLIQIICPIHGVFEQRAMTHLTGCGCQTCGIEHKQTNLLSLSEFLEKAKNIHGEKYNYEQVIYNGTERKVIIKCSIHGEFKQTPHNHISNKQGCPNCKKSFGHDNVKYYLTEKKISFIEEHWFDNCRNPKTNRLLRFDFYLPDFNICIEFDGIQHQTPFSFSSDQTEETKLKNLLELQYRDNIKNEYCKNNEVELIRIPNIYRERVSDYLTIFNI